MKHLFFILVMVIGLSVDALALSCERTDGGFGFSSVSIDEIGRTTCSYTYCYYGCMGRSFKLQGCYSPGNGPWTKDGAYFSCQGRHDECQLDTKSCPPNERL